MLALGAVRAQAGEAMPGGATEQKFKPRYAGTSVDAGMMFTSGFGSAYYVAPKINFQVAPRLFFNAGVGLVQYTPLGTKSDLFSGRPSPTVNAYIFAEGTYLLNEKWSVNGSVMKDLGAGGSSRRVSPYSVPSEAMHLGVDYKVTPNITIGARVGYSNGRRNNYYDPFTPF